jgi:hypothetical protein
MPNQKIEELFLKKPQESGYILKKEMNLMHNYKEPTKT